MCVIAVLPSQVFAACPSNKIVAVEDNAWNVEIDVPGRQWKAVGPGGALKTAIVGVICLGSIVKMQQSASSDGNDCSYNLPVDAQNNQMTGSYACSANQPRPGALFVGQFQ